MRVAGTKVIVPMVSVLLLLPSNSMVVKAFFQGHGHGISFQRDEGTSFIPSHVFNGNRVRAVDGAIGRQDHVKLSLGFVRKVN